VYNPSFIASRRLPLSTDVNFDKTEKFISELTAYCPTFGPLSPIANDNQFDVEAVLDSLQDQEADVCVVPNQLRESVGSDSLSFKII
jgi:hypothetical protein